MSDTLYQATAPVIVPPASGSALSAFVPWAAVAYAVDAVNAAELSTSLALSSRFNVLVVRLPLVVLALSAALNVGASLVPLMMKLSVLLLHSVARMQGLVCSTPQASSYFLIGSAWQDWRENISPTLR